MRIRCYLIHSAYSSHGYSTWRNHSNYGTVYREYQISRSGSVTQLLPRLPNGMAISIHWFFLMKKDQSFVSVMLSSAQQQSRMKSEGHCNVFISAQWNLVSVVADDFFNDTVVDLCHITQSPQDIYHMKIYPWALWVVLPPLLPPQQASLKCRHQRGWFIDNANKEVLQKISKYLEKKKICTKTIMSSKAIYMGLQILCLGSPFCTNTILMGISLLHSTCT